MIKILTTEQIREADAYTIQNEPIASYELMERASNAFVEKFLQLFEAKRPIRIFCGVGNNGGDGLAIGRILKERGWEVLKYIVGNPRNGTDDFKQNLEKSDLYAVINSCEDLPSIDSEEFIIDALFGSGLSRPVEGLPQEVLSYLNDLESTKVAVDIPSGLYAEKPIDKESSALRADYTISFQNPKLIFFLPEYHRYVGHWHVVDIGLSRTFLEKAETNFYYTELQDVRKSIPKRSKYAYKSQVGKLMIVAGSKGKMGAAILATRAAFRSGVGLINVVCPKFGTPIMQAAVPEAMVMESDAVTYIGKIPKADDSIVLGPGLGTQAKTISAFEDLLRSASLPLVIDADGINILSKKNALLKLLPEDSVLTPHPGEFKRLVGEWSDDFDKLGKLSSFCKENKVNAVLKGAYSAVCDKSGKLFFNSSGNPVLATAGSGDVLAGMVGSFLAMGLTGFEALRIGVYVHGYCGDLLAEKNDGIGVIASDILEMIPHALFRTSSV